MLKVMCDAYGGSCSDESIVVERGFLRKIDFQRMITDEKVFNSTNDCADRFICLHFLLDERGHAQTAKVALNKTI